MLHQTMQKKLNISYIITIFVCLNEVENYNEIKQKRFLKSLWDFLLENMY
jgi:hypothetical protein